MTATDVPVSSRVPFAERGGTLRGVLDLATLRYPLFLFGAPIGRTLPVFHLHDESPSALDTQFAFLAEHGYTTVTSDAIAGFVRDGRHPGPNTVALCFDDARASVWTVALPRLKTYGLRALTFAIPGRMVEAATCRPHRDDGASTDEGSPFCTWPELTELHRSGIVDVQSHGYSHASIFCHADPIGFVTPAFAARTIFERPLISEGHEPEFLSPSALGAPLFPQRSRLSDARRFVDDGEVRARLVAFVETHGGPRFFERSTWQAELRELLPPRTGRHESDQERRTAIHAELDRSRSVLNDRLRTTTVRYLCFPWGVGGALAREAARSVGYETAFSERLFGLRAVRAGDDPYRLMRLNGKFITWLPRRRRPTVGVSAPGDPSGARR